MAKKANNDTSRFVLTVALKICDWQADIIDKRLEIARKLYNMLVNKSLKRYNELIHDKNYRQLLDSLDHDKKHPEHDKLIWKEINKMRAEVGLTEYGLIKMMTSLRKHYDMHIGAHEAQALASNLWDAYEDLFYGDAKQIHYRKFGQRNSLEETDIKTGIRFFPKKKICTWGNRPKNKKAKLKKRSREEKLLTFPVIIGKNDFEKECLKCPIAYSRILRKYIRGKRRYFLQIVFKGVRPEKFHKDGSKVLNLGEGDIGIDIGTSTIAYASEKEVYIKELADKVQGLEDERKKLLRKMDRSRRATNPDNYNVDGTVKSKKKRKSWIKSKSYMKILFRLKEIYRKQAAVRKQQHEELANHILSLGNNIYVEKMDFKALAKKAKETEKSEKTGRFKRKKRFGKSIANRAPSMLLEIIDRKLKYFGKELKKINTWTVKASQYIHFEDGYKKKLLSERWNNFEEYCGQKVQRDMYSAFLIMNVTQDLEKVDLAKCNIRFNNFLRLHNIAIEELAGKKNLSCVGI